MLDLSKLDREPFKLYELTCKKKLLYKENVPLKIQYQFEETLLNLRNYLALNGVSMEFKVNKGGFRHDG